MMMMMMMMIMMMMTMNNNAHRPSIWFRYVDDTFTLFDCKNTAIQFLHYLNNCHSNIKLCLSPQFACYFLYGLSHSGASPARRAGERSPISIEIGETDENHA